MRGRRCASGYHEGMQRLQRGVDLVAGPLQPGGVGVVHAQARARARGVVGRRGHRQVGAQVEQVVLHPRQPLGEALGEVRLDQREADRGVQLVHRAVRLHARVELGNTAHVAEIGLPGIAALGVDPRQVDGHRSSPRVSHTAGRWGLRGTHAGVRLADRVRSRPCNADRGPEGDRRGRASCRARAGGHRQADGARNRRHRAAGRGGGGPARRRRLHRRRAPRSATTPRRSGAATP